MLTVIREMAEESERKEHRRVPPQRAPRRSVLARGRGRARADAGDARRPAQRRCRRRGRRRARRDRARHGLRRDRRGRCRRRRSRAEALGLDAIHLELSEYRYCTVFVVEGDGPRHGRARERRSRQIGDSLLVVGDETALKVHVHTDDPGQRAHARRRRVGVVEGVEIANMHAPDRAARGAPARGSAGAALATLETGLVAVCPGRGNRRLFESLGATTRHRGRSVDEPVGRGHPRRDRGRADGRRARPSEQLERDPHRRAGGDA